MILARVPESDAEVVRRMFAAFAERDRDGLLAVMDPEVEFLPVTANLTTGGVPYRGHDGIVRYLEDVARVWPELRLFPEEYRGADGMVVTLGRVVARGGGMIIDRPTGWVWRMREGKIVWGRVYSTQEDALRAVGLQE